MKLTAKLAITVWVTVAASIGLSFLFWRIENLRPHACWALLSIVSIAVPMVGLVIVALKSVVRGPDRLRAIGWLLVGASPLIWIGVYFTYLSIDARTRAPIKLNVPLRLTLTWATSFLALEARWHYPRWVHGKHAVLIDAGQTQEATRLVTEMDSHLEAMAKLLGQPVPACEFPWVRGSLVGYNGRAIGLWALCGQEDNPGELTHLDRHENAHTLITALAGSDHDPPFVLIEGWAETQSSDRDSHIRDLARVYKEGSAYSLAELVGPHWYGKDSGPVYSQGGPLVHYLMEHYGPEKFFELYSGVRSGTFHDDCQAILGDSWETVENDFWEWVDLESGRIAAKKSQPSAEPVIEISAAVNPADWRALVEGYRTSHKDVEPLPTYQAFLVELDRVITDPQAGFVKKPFHFEFRAVFEEDQFWITENFSLNKERFLLSTKERCASLWQDEAEGMKGWVQGHHAFRRVRASAIELIRLHLRVGDVGDLISLTDTDSVSMDVTWQITELTRPEEGSGEPWSISCTTTAQSEDEETIYNRQMEIDPALNWTIIRYRVEVPGSFMAVSEGQYQHLHGVVMPVKLNSRHSRGNNEVIAEVHLRPLAKHEQLELKKRVERAVQTAPPPHFYQLKRVLFAIAILCPLVGVLLLGFSPPVESQLSIVA